MNCDICKKREATSQDFVQRPKGFIKVNVCPVCHAEIERDREMTRQNFQRQFGN